jgi:class 3 adenylate cyclase
MSCERCGGERRYRALSNKPDPGYQQVDHTPEECIAILRSRVNALAEALDRGRETLHKVIADRADMQATLANAIRIVCAASNDAERALRKNGLL